MKIHLCDMVPLLLPRGWKETTKNSNDIKIINE